MSARRALLDLDFWRGKRVLITGHTGFKGSWLAIWLKHLGCSVWGLSLRPSSKPALFELADVSKLMTGQNFLDIRDAVGVHYAVEEARPEIVFHLAAQALVRQSYRDPLETFSTNIMGTANVLDALRLIGSVKATIMVTSDKVYRNVETMEPYVETDPLGGRDPYSASKSATELIIDCYRNAFLDDLEVSVASVRAGNVIGGGDWALDRLIPDAIRAWSSGHQLLVRYPNSIRPWQHVLEPLHGYLILAQRLSNEPTLSRAFNFGPATNDAATVRYVIELAQNAWGGGKVSWGEHSDSMHEASLLRLETSLSRELLGIKSSWSVETAIERSLAWYRRQLSGESALDLCINDIEHFERRFERND